MAVRISGHGLLDLPAQLAGDLDRGGVGNLSGRLCQVDRLIPAGDARAVSEARHAHLLAHGSLAIGRTTGGAHGRLLQRPEAHLSIPPRIGSSIATVAIRSAM